MIELTDEEIFEMWLAVDAVYMAPFRITPNKYLSYIGLLGIAKGRIQWTLSDN